MKTSDALLAYEDIRLVADRALSSPRGVAVTRTSHSDAVRFRQRFYLFRKLMRKLSTEMWPVESPEYGRSPYENLTIKNWEKGDGAVRVEIVKVSEVKLEVEDL